MTLPRTLPRDPIFERLCELSKTVPGESIHDDSGVNATYARLITDVIQLRQQLQEQLPRGLFNERGVLHSNSIPIGFVDSSGYDFIVSFLAIVALGGMCTPIVNVLNLEETLYVLKKCDSRFLLADDSVLDRALKVKSFAEDNGYHNIHVIKTSRNHSKSTLCAEIELDEDIISPPTTGCLVLFTSGSTGPPKGTVIPRSRFYLLKPCSGSGQRFLASNNLGGVAGATGIMDRLLQGQALHILQPGSGPAKIWDVLSHTKVTELIIIGSSLTDLMNYYNDIIRSLSPDDRMKYTKGIQNLKRVRVGGTRVNPPTLNFFTNVMRVPIENTYAMTEMSGAIMAGQGPRIADGYVGCPLPGFEVKLSNGYEGEILVKGPNMMLGYINDEEATRAVFDHEGFYKTGDHGHREGNDYFIDGRVSGDWIRFYGRKISLPRLEQRLYSLPYIQEVHVLGVPDHEAGGLPAALIRVQPGDTGDDSYGIIDLRRIRADLTACDVSVEKLPRLLRILKPAEEVPLTRTHKVLKRECLRRFFDISEYLPDNYAVDGVEYCGNHPDTGTSTWFDWGGI